MVNAYEGQKQHKVQPSLCHTSQAQDVKMTAPHDCLHLESIPKSWPEKRPLHGRKVLQLLKLKVLKNSNQMQQEPQLLLLELEQLIASAKTLASAHTAAASHKAGLCLLESARKTSASFVHLQHVQPPPRHPCRG